MALGSGKNFKNMLKLGWDIILADPTINYNNLVAELGSQSSYDDTDWMNGLTTLSELGYFDAAGSWADARTWFLSVDSNNASHIADIVEYYFQISPTMQVQLLTSQRAELVTQQSDLYDTAVNILDPFIASPPAGTDPLVVVAVQSERTRMQSLYVQLAEQIALIDERLAEYA